MSIVKMSKIKLISLETYKENILNALQKSGIIQLSQPEEIVDTFCVVDEEKKHNLNNLLNSTDNAINFYTNQINKSVSEKYYQDNFKKYINNFFVSYEDFSSIKNKEIEIKNIITQSENAEKQLSDYKTEKTKLLNLKNQLLPYISIKDSFKDFYDTKQTKIFFGTIKNEFMSRFLDLKNNFDFTDYEVLCKEPTNIVCVVTINENYEKVLKFLTEISFSKCTFDFFMNAEQKINLINKEISEISEKENLISEDICKHSDNLKTLKIYYDYVLYLSEKELDSEKFRRTSKTFILEGFIPKDKVEEVSLYLKQICSAIFIEISEPSSNEVVPTLTKNGPIVRQSEIITDMYSVPNYKEIDPNKVVFLFFMIFMGLIMSDIGYGIIMIFVGILIASKTKVENNTKRLWNVIAIGGVFTILFGILFNSFFGFAVLPFTIIDSPTPDLVTGAINLELIMKLLLASLGLGIIQIAVGYLCKAINSFRQKDYVGAITEGLVWVFFFVGMVLSLFNFLCDYLNVNVSENIKAFFNEFSTFGLILVVANLFIAAVFAGRNEKGFGKISKGFGTLYGLINIVSDILSYARLFGLMISGMIISQTFNYKLGMPFIEKGGVSIVLGAIIIIIGHLFNLGMGVLGAYIHDSRLQYIEFFSKFYTGEGEKFTPFGSQTKYIYLTK